MFCFADKHREHQYRAVEAQHLQIGEDPVPAQT